MKITLFEAVNLAVKQKSVDVLSFFAVLTLVALFLLSMPFSSGVQILLMKKMHLRSDSFLQWSALQFVPSMYNFNNTILIEPEGFTGQINHYPLRVITYRPAVRQSLAESGRDFLLTANSTYQGTALTSRFELRSVPPVLILNDITDDKE